MSEENQTQAWESDILAQLDCCAQEYNFPIFNNIYFDHADARLTVFRNSLEWLIVFEEIAFSRKQRSFINSISAYGNKVENPGVQEAITIIEDAPGCPIWDEQGNFLLDPYSFEIFLNGEIKRISVSSSDYEAAGIEISSSMSRPAQILRLLVNLEQSNCFLKNERLLEICGRSNAGLELFLQLYDWFHPDVADDELPSENSCFQNLVLSIVRSDPSLYSCPEDELNTHWSYWQIETD